MDSGTTPATIPATTWDQRNWDELLSYIEQKNVIPILGLDLVLVTREVEIPPVHLPCAVARDMRVLHRRGAATRSDLDLVERLAAPHRAQCQPPSPTSP